MKINRFEFKSQLHWASQVVPVVKNLPASAGYVRDSGSIPGSGRSPGVGHGNPLQYSCLENSMDCIAHGVAKSQTQLSDFHFHPISRDSQVVLVVKNLPANAGDLRD